MCFAIGTWKVSRTSVGMQGSEPREGMGKASVPCDAAYIKGAFPELENIKDDGVM